MQTFLLAGLVLVTLLNLVAAPLRHRVNLIAAGDRLVLRSQRAALRLDATILCICLIVLCITVAARSPLGMVCGGLATAAVAGRLVAARRAPVFTFDRAGNQLWRDAQSLCPLTQIEALELVAGKQSCALQLRFRDGRGAQRRQRLYVASPPQAAALRAAIADFLAAR